MKKYLLILISITPVFAFAALQNVGSILGTVLGLLNTTVPILISLAVIYFIWGVAQYVVGGDMEKKEQGQQHMIWGIIGFFVIVSMWGLVAILSNTFGISDQNNIQSAGVLPCINVDPSTTNDGC